MLLAVEVILAFLLVNHDTPIYYSVKSHEAKDVSKKEQFILKRNNILKKFHKYKEELYNEMGYLDKMANELENKSTEKSAWELIYNNCINKKTRWSFLAIMAYNFWPPLAGLTYADNYMSIIFDKLNYDGFGYKLTFYSGFFCVAGSICTCIFINRINRVTLLCVTQLIISICMWLLAFAFYFKFVYMAVVVN